MGTHRWSDLAAVAFLIVFLSAIYGARLGRQPLVGEETRWATGAREMLATGDWIVPRQQGRVFPERPPMTMWAMAAAGWLRGDVDAIAIRLPSVVGVALTSLLIYAYARALLSQIAALTAALVYATMGQVLQIGRLGESEALFALLLSASLLLWHFGYASGREPIVTWTIGFACAALAALVKGPQAPVYFVAITAVYLAVRRDWRWLVCWEYAAGAAVFAIIVAAWQIPFYLATDWPTVVATWSGLAGDRFHLGGMAQHFVTYPLETFACLLPWSPLLVALAKRETRVLLSDARPVVSFLVTALLVAYPSVWMAAGARGRYFMPLYPLVAVLIGLIIERCSAACVVGYPRRAWRQFMLLSSVLIGGGGALFGISGLLPGESASWMHQPRWFGIMLGIAAIVCVYVIWRCFRAADRIATIGVVLTVALFVGIAYAGVMINVNSARWTDPTQLVREMKHIVPADVPLVSLTPIEHRFAYYFREPIAELDWPRDARELPDHVQYFCFMRNPGDTAERRAAGRGRSWTYTSGTLPFAWEELASFCVDRRVPEGEKRMVVIGRVFRPLRAGVYDATVPQQATARQSQDVQRR
jgi:4-amino-4-deoxy-L-arabinose transferase-like glycosyltransferase